MRGVLAAWILKRPISWAAMAFVALSVFVNIVVFSVTEGMISGFIDLVLRQVPDLTIRHLDDHGGSTDRWEEPDFRESVTALGIDGSLLWELKSPGLVRAIRGDRTTGGVIRGVSREGFSEVLNPIRDISRALTNFVDGAGPIPVILTERMSFEIGALPGDEVELFTNVPSPVASPVPRPRTGRAQGRVLAVCQLRSQLDSYSIFIPLKSMQRFMNRAGEDAELSEVHVRFAKRPGQLMEFESFLRALYGSENQLDDALARDRDRGAGRFDVRVPLKNMAMFSQTYVELKMVQAIVLFVIVLAACAIFLMIHLLMRSQVRTLGLLMAMGVSRMRMFGMVIGFGVAITLLGAAFGWSGGALFMAHIQDIHDWLIHEVLELPGGIFDVYGFNGFPSAYTPTLGFLISLSVVVLGGIAALLPAWFTSRLQPSEVLKNE